MLKRCSRSNGEVVQKKRLRVYKKSSNNETEALYPWMELFILHSCQLTSLAPKRRIASLSTTLYRCVAIELASQLRQSIRHQEICLTLAKEEVALWFSQWRAYMVHQWNNTTLPSDEEIDFLSKTPDILGCFHMGHARSIESPLLQYSQSLAASLANALSPTRAQQRCRTWRGGFQRYMGGFKPEGRNQRHYGFAGVVHARQRT